MSQIPTGRFLKYACALGLLVAPVCGGWTAQQQYQVVATVTDRNGRYATKLRDRDFVVEVNGTRVAVSSLTLASNVPRTIGFIVDRSLGLSFTMEAELKATSQFFESLDPKDEFFLFAADSLATTLLQDYTHDPNLLVRQLLSFQSLVAGETDLAAAIVQASAKARMASNPRRALIVLSDGGQLREKPVLSSAISVYPIQVLPPLSPTVFRPTRGARLASPPLAPGDVEISGTSPRGATVRGPSTPSRRNGPPPLAPSLQREIEAKRLAAGKLLQSIAEDTGGRFFTLPAVESMSGLLRQFDEIYTKISSELQSQYLITFEALPAAQIRIRTVNPGYRIRYAISD